MAREKTRPSLGVSGRRLRFELLEEKTLLAGGPLPDDPLFPLQYHHDPAHMDNVGAWQYLNDSGFSDHLYGNRGVTVAVIDTGFDLAHEDLATNVWINQGEIPSALFANLIDVDDDQMITFVDLNARGQTDVRR